MEETGLEVLTPGSLISNRYTIQRLLGQGGMGCVYIASDRVLGSQFIAVKVLHREMVQDQSLVKRFLREVELMHKVNHANVVRTYDVGIDGSLVYFTMEYVTGMPLDAIVDAIHETGPLSPQRIAHLGLQMASGLTAIHAENILHRDLKPQNVLVLEDDGIKITDFGVARPSDSKLTKHTEILGSIHYIAPEVWLGQNLTSSVDLYALGVILYEMTTGVLPFVGEEPARLMWMHSKQPPKAPRVLRPDTPNWLNQLILGLLQKTPAQRPRSAANIRAFLEANVENYSQYVRATEMIEGDEQTATTTLASQRVQPVEQSDFRYRPARKTTDPSYRGWVLATLAIVGLICAIVIPTKEICACESIEEHIYKTVGIPPSLEMTSAEVGPHISEYTPGGMMRYTAEKRLMRLAASQPSRCRYVNRDIFLCRFVLRKGIVQARVLEVSVEYNPEFPDVVHSVTLRDFTEFFGFVFPSTGNR